MGDLWDQLRGAGSDEERARLMYLDVLQSLGEDLTLALSVLSVPHWFDKKILGDLERHGYGPLQVRPTAVTDLVNLGLVRESGATFSAIEPVRELCLDRLIRDQLDDFRRFSRFFADRFGQDQAGEEPAIVIEAIYHRLGAAPSDGAKEFLARGLQWKSEPCFNWDALERLVLAADEQHNRNVTNSDAAKYIRFLKLFVPRFRGPPRDDATVLMELLESAPANPQFVAEANLRLGLALLTLGEMPRAGESLNAALMIFKGLGAGLGVAQAWQALGRWFFRQDDYRRAEECFLAALDEARVLGAIVSVSHSLKGIADLDFLQGSYPRARAGFDHAAKQYAVARAHLGEANARVSAAQLLALQHNFKEAEAYVDSAEPIYGQLGQSQSLGTGNCKKARGIICYEQENYEQALAYFDQADRSYMEAGNRTGLAYCNVMRGATLINVGRLSEVKGMLSRAEETFKDTRDRYGAVMAKRELGLLADRQDELTTALTTLIEAAESFDKIPIPVEALATWVAAGRVAAKLKFPTRLDREAVIEKTALAADMFERNSLPRRLAEWRALSRELTRPDAAI